MKLIVRALLEVARACQPDPLKPLEEAIAYGFEESFRDTRPCNPDGVRPKASLLYNSKFEWLLCTHIHADRSEQHTC